MPAKPGVRFDYDLDALEHCKPEDVCIICDSPLRCRWTDLNGEGVCLDCGAPYQLKNGSDEQRAEGNYPYCNLKTEWIPIMRHFWQRTGCFVFLGSSFSENTGRVYFAEWVRGHYPEMISEGVNQ